MVTGSVPGVSLAGCESGLYPSPVCDWESFLTVLGLSFCICKMGRMVVPSSQGCCEDSVSSCG